MQKKLTCFKLKRKNMRKLTLALIYGVITLIPVITKAQAFEEGKSQISLGYGLVNSTQAFVFAYGELENSSLGPNFLKYEYGVSEKVGLLYCIDPSSALEVAKKNLSKKKNCVFLKETVENLSIQDESMDFGYSLGVLHHVEDTFMGIKECVVKLKKNAPFLIYLYYSLDNKPRFYRNLWIISDLFRIIISKLPFFFRFYITQILCILIYFCFH